MQDIDLRSLFPAARDQGRRETCVVFAATSGHEYLRYGTTSLMEDLSEEALYYQCKVIDGNRNSGTSFDSAGQALQTVGQTGEDKWPYDKRRDETLPDYLPPPEAVDPQFCYQARLTKIQPDLNAIVACLAQGKPVVIGISLYDSFNMAPAGRVPMPRTHEQVVGRHALLAVGCEADDQQSEWLIFRNSWGARWGENGYGFLRFEYIGNYGCKAFVVETITTI